MKRNIRSIVYSYLAIIFCCANEANAQITITTFSTPPINLAFNQIFSQTGKGIHASVQYPVIDSFIVKAKNANLRIACTIEQLSPQNFKIGLKNDAALGAHIKVTAGPIPRELSKDELEQAFGSFTENNLFFEGIAFSDLNGRLPDGVYRVCFTADGNKYPDKCCNFPCMNPDPIECDSIPFETSAGCTNFTIVSCTQPINGAAITTTINNPVNPVVKELVANGITSNVQFTNPPGCSTQVKLFGKIERISPSPFTIELNPDFNNQPFITLKSGNTKLSSKQLLSAFSNFNEVDLVSSGIDLTSIKDANGNIRLPDGNYNICYYARYLNANQQLGENASDPNLGCGNFTINCAPLNGVQISTIAKPQINSIISQAISSGGFSTTLQITNQPLCNTQVKLFGKIERLSPSPFSISLKPDYTDQQAILLNAGSIVNLTTTQQQQAFGNFQEENLVIEGTDPSLVKDATGNIKLPDGNYRICFSARYLNSDGGLAGEASNPALGCGNFTLCNQAGGAPQFTQPINNLDITSDISMVSPASPVIFTWTPPQSNCGLPPGGFTYDFEIRELFSNQTVTDALNNPYVFQKKALPSTTFPLDTNLYRNVLQTGRRYAIRVRAINNNTASPVEIDNDGYSRIEAFQYGGNLISTNHFYDPQDYYIGFKERKSSYWDDVNTRYKNHLQGDTSLPIKEYIGFALMENGMAYSVDAIELFLTLNPELAEVKKVKLSYTPKLPVWPTVAANDQSNFDKDYLIDLEPDKSAENKFSKYIDTLNSYQQKAPQKATALVSDLAAYLATVKANIDSVDRTTVDYINSVLAELLYQLRQAPKGFNNAQYNQLQKLATVLKDLTTSDLNNTSFYNLFPLHKKSSLTSYTINQHSNNTVVNTALSLKGINNFDNVLASIIKQLLPFNIVVYRNAKEPPYKPVLEAPDLNAAYRIYYSLSELYNHKNPNVNAKSTSRLASTVQVSLPANASFTFRALNMLNHKSTKPEDVDLKDVFSKASKVMPETKKLTVVLKVD